MSPSPTTTATPSVTPTTQAPLLPGLQGVQVFEGDVEAIWGGPVRASGAYWARARVLWSAVEPANTQPPAYTWGMSDSVIGGLGHEGLMTMATIYGNPAWAASTPCGGVDRVPMARFAAFVGAAVERYDGDGLADAPGSPRVRQWEFYNEPDFMRSQASTYGDPPDGYGGCFGDDPAAYAAQLRAAYVATKAADPTAEVIFGSVAFDRFHDNADYPPQNRGPFRYLFVRDSLSAMASSFGTEPQYPFFDVIGFHNYNDFRNYWDTPTAPELMGKAEHLRSRQMVGPGFDLRGRPMLATEVGIPSAPSDSFTRRTEDYQAAYVGQVLVRALAAGLREAIWYTAEDNEADPGRCSDPYSWKTHGLMRSLWVAARAAGCSPNPLPGYAPAAAHEPKPSYTALATFARRIGSAAFEARLTGADPVIDQYRVAFGDGRRGLVLFTDHGERLGHRGSADQQRALTVGPAQLPGWTGRVRITDYLGASRIETGATVTVLVGHRPTYVEVVP